MIVAKVRKKLLFIIAGVAIFGGLAFMILDTYMSPPKSDNDHTELQSVELEGDKNSDMFTQENKTVENTKEPAPQSTKSPKVSPQSTDASSSEVEYQKKQEAAAAKQKQSVEQEQAYLKSVAMSQAESIYQNCQSLNSTYKNSKDSELAKIADTYAIKRKQAIGGWAMDIVNQWYNGEISRVQNEYSGKLKDCAQAKSDYLKGMGY